MSETPSCSETPASDGRGRPRRQPRFSRQSPEQRRGEIIAAALRCLAKGGLGAFTVSEICAEAGISHGLINHYFASKEDLLVATYDRVAEDLVRLTREAVRRTSRRPADKLVAMVESSFDDAIFNNTNLSVWVALWGQVRNHEGLRQKHNELYEGYHRSIARIVKQLAAERDLACDGDSLARALTALIDGLWLEHCLTPQRFSREQALRCCYELLEPRVGPLTPGRKDCTS